MPRGIPPPNHEPEELEMSRAKTIYIADDETNIRLAIKTFLENAGFSVVDFENGDLLLRAFSENPADLVVLDVLLKLWIFSMR